MKKVFGIILMLFGLIASFLGALRIKDLLAFGTKEKEALKAMNESITLYAIQFGSILAVGIILIIIGIFLFKKKS